jgi:hypothetical protein
LNDAESAAPVVGGAKPMIPIGVEPPAKADSSSLEEESRDIVFVFIQSVAAHVDHFAKLIEELPVMRVIIEVQQNIPPIDHGEEEMASGVVGL